MSGRIATGSEWLDQSLGGGLLRGALTAVTGTSGKSAAALSIMAAARMAGLEVALVDTEDVGRQAPDGVLWCRASCSAAALPMAARLSGCGGVDLVVLNVLGDVDSGTLRWLSRRGAVGDCALLVLVRAAPFGRVATALSLGAAARIDVQAAGRLRVVVKGRAVCWGSPGGSPRAAS